MFHSHGLRALVFIFAAALVAPAVYAGQGSAAHNNLVAHFAAAYMKLQPIWKQTDRKLGAANTDAKRKKINQASQEKQAKIIRSEGLTIKQFNAFIDKANRDKDFKAQVTKKINQLRTDKILGIGSS
jgi:hypothetical protein